MSTQQDLNRSGNPQTITLALGYAESCSVTRCVSPSTMLMSSFLEDDGMPPNPRLSSPGQVIHRESALCSLLRGGWLFLKAAHKKLGLLCSMTLLVGANQCACSAGLRCAGADPAVPLRPRGLLSGQEMDVCSFVGLLHVPLPGPSAAGLGTCSGPALEDHMPQFRSLHRVSAATQGVWLA